MAKRVVRNNRVTVRLSDSEYADLKQSASRAGCASVSEYLRTVADGTQKSFTTIAIDTTALTDSTFQLACVGRNLNQIARVINSGEQPDENKLWTGFAKVYRKVCGLEEEIRNLAIDIANFNMKCGK